MQRDRLGRTALRIGGGLLALATAAFVAVEVARQWDEIAAIVRDADPWWLVASVVAFMIAEAAYASAWPATLRRVGYPVAPVTASATFLVTQTAKFVPGSVWHAVGRVGTADRLGVPKRVVGGALAQEVSASVAAAVLVAGVGGAVSPFLVDEVGAWQRLLEMALTALTAVAAALVGRRAAVRIAGRPLLEGRAFGVVLAWHLAVWVGYGIAAGFLASGLGAPLLPTVGVFSLAWVAGFVVVGAPAGLGVREAVMTAALTPTAGADVALTIALGTRAVWTLVQLGGAALAVPYLARRGRWATGPDVAPPGRRLEHGLVHDGRLTRIFALDPPGDPAAGDELPADVGFVGDEGAG